MICVPICPECREEFTRFEYLEGWTGFCHPCAKHFELCHSTLYMARCVRSHGHYGNHIDDSGHEFVDDGKTHPYRVAPTSNRTIFDYKVIDQRISEERVVKQQPKPSSKSNLGWVVSEEIGRAYVNPRGLAAGDKNVVIGK